MSTHIPSKQYPPRIYQRRFARNGHPVSALFMKRIADGLMHDVAWRGQKVVIQYSRDWNAVPAPAAGTVPLWRARFRAPYGAERLKCHVGMHPVSSHYGAVDPRVIMAAKHSGGTITSNALHFASMDGSGGITAAVPDDVYWGFIPEIAIVPNTEYELTISAIDYAIPLAAMAWTAPAPPMDDTDTGVVDPSPYSVGANITDTNHSDMLVAGNNLWDRCAAPLIAYTSDQASASTSSTTTTGINILDQTSTAHSSSTPGWRFDLASRNRHAVTTVPLVFCAYGKVTAGAGTGTVTFTDGTTTVDLAGITGTEGWFTTTASVPASKSKWDAIIKVSGAGTTVRVDALSVYQER